MGPVTDTPMTDPARAASRLPEEARTALAAPAARIAVTTVTRDGGRRLDAYPVAGGSFVALTPKGDGDAAVGYPLGGVDIEALIAGALGLAEPLADIGYRGELPAAALWALAALADAHRQLELESLLARVPARRLALDADTVYLRALDGASLPDPRWLSGLLTQLMGAGDVTEARLQAGLAALARAGLIAERNGVWSPQPTFALAFAHLEVPLAGARLAIEIAGARSTLVLLRTLAALWLLHSRGEQVLLRSVDGAAARQAIRDAVAAATPQARAPAQRSCPRCGSPAAATDRFCAKCGTALSS